MHVLPEPQAIEYGSGSLPIHGLTIAFASALTPEDRFSAQELARGLARKTGIHVPIVDSLASAPVIVLKRTDPVDPLLLSGEKSGPDSREAYRLKIDSHGVQITCRSSAAVFYGEQ